ncbi:MAG: cation transporter [Bacteroidetes bacterium]|nr:cation transporter [Bacteroidota bacterium]
MMATNSDAGNAKIRTMRTMLFFSIVIMTIKFIAYFITHSVAVLSDALESIINIAAGAFALFSIYYASLPKDRDHPYGHGKIENISVQIEGVLILIAGLAIILKGIYSFFHPPELEKLDTGLVFSGVAGLCNFFMGNYLEKKGKHYNSIVMIADGKHLISDTVSSIGLIVGLGVIYFTHLLWIDNVLAIIFGAVILWTGFKLIRESVFNLLDKADVEKLNQLTDILNKNRREKWIDMHNLRILKYGSQLHIDAHLTLPWYETLEQTHEEVSAMEKVIRENMGNEIEFFIHADPCPPSSCPLCVISNCVHRKSPFVKRLDWTFENIIPDSKHKI